MAESLICCYRGLVLLVLLAVVVTHFADAQSKILYTATTSSVSVTTRERLIQLTPSAKVSTAVIAAIISSISCLVVGLAIGVLVILLRRFRGTSSQQRDQAQPRPRTSTQDQAPVVFSKGRDGPTYENEGPGKLGAHPSCGGLAHQMTGPAMEAAGLYENAPCLTDNISDDTVAQRAIPSSMKDCEDQQVYMNHQVQKGKPHLGPRK